MEPEKTELNEPEQVSDKFKNDTPVYASVKEKFRIEKRKIKEMPFKKKVEYIWEYYKFHLIVIILILAIAGGIINSVFINPRPQITLFVAWSTGFITDEQTSDLTEKMNERIIEPKANETVEINMFFPTADDPSMDAAQIQRLAAMLSAGMIDVFILDFEMLEGYASFGYLEPMESFLNDIRRINPTVYNRIAENTVTVEYTTFEGVTYKNIMGVDISNSRLLNELGFFDFDRIFSLAISASFPGNAAEALILLFE